MEVEQLGKDKILEEAAGVLKDILQELDLRDEGSGMLDEEEAGAVGLTLLKLSSYLFALKNPDGTPFTIPFGHPHDAPTPILRTISGLLARDHSRALNPQLSSILIRVADHLTDGDTARLPHLMIEQHDLSPTSPEWLDNCGVIQALHGHNLKLERAGRRRRRAGPRVTRVALQTSEPNEAAAGGVTDVVSRINSRFSTLTYQPVVFLHTQDLTSSQYLALLTVADVFIVTSLHEGMALRTHEFVECQESSYRPLILSEFTGSYSYSGFRSCIAINPWDTRGTANAIKQALTMDDEEALSLGRPAQPCHDANSIGLHHILPRPLRAHQHRAHRLVRGLAQPLSVCRAQTDTISSPPQVQALAEAHNPRQLQRRAVAPQSQPEGGAGPAWQEGQGFGGAV